MMVRWCVTAVFIVALAASLTGCANLGTPGKVLSTPITVVRDVVDVPLVSATNVFEQGAEAIRPDAYMSAPGDWELVDNPITQIPIDLGFFVMKTLSYGFGAVDYVVSRSLYPNPYKGISPWVEEDTLWTGDMFFPGTKALWEE